MPELEDNEEGGEQVDPIIGRRLQDTYELVERIGEGGMGAVYSAIQHPLDRQVAVKVVQPDSTNSGSSEHYFQREVEAINRLRHPNIVNVVDYGTDPDGLLYLVMEFLPGRTLRDIIAEEFPVDTIRICDIAVQILSALEQAHDSGVIHRDLKPANIMLEEVAGQRDFVKILDFGIAKVKGPAMEAGPHTQKGDLVGTFDYMSPEQIMRDDLDGRTDVWSVGVILFELLTQRRIFHAEDAVGTVGRVMRSEIPSPSDFVSGVPEGLEALIEQALTRRVENRPAAGELREQFSQLRDRLRTRSRPGAVIEQRDGVDDSPDFDLTGGAGRGADPGEDSANLSTRSVSSIAMGAQPAGRGVYIERPQLRERTRECLRRVGDGDFGGLALVGPEGSGKSTFLQRTGERLVGEGWQVLSSRHGLDDGGPLTFVRSWLDLMVERRETPDGFYEELLEELGLTHRAEAVATYLSEGPGAVERERLPWVEPDQFVLFASRLLTAALRRSLRYGPICLILDDLDTEDDRTRRLLDGLTASLSEYPVTILTAVDADPGEVLVPNDFAIEAVEGFEPDQLETYLDHQFGIDFSETVVSRVSQRTRRLPGELDLLTDSLGGREASQPSTSARLSARVSLDSEELFAERVDQLDAEHRDAYERAAILGAAFPVWLLVDFVGDLDHPDGVVNRVIDSQFLRRERLPGGESVVCWRSGATRRRFDGTLERRRRRMLFAEAFDLLRDAVDRIDEVLRLEGLARCRMGMGDGEPSMRALLKAGDMRLERFDRVGAIRDWQTATDALDAERLSANDATVARILCRLVAACRESGRLEEAEGRIGALKSFASSPEERRPQVLYEIGRTQLAAGRTKEAGRTLRHAWRAMCDAEDAAGEIDALLALSEVYEQVSAFEKAETLLKKAVRRADRLGGDVPRQELRWQAHNAFGMFVLKRTDIDRATEILKVGLDRARRIGDVNGEVRIGSNIGAAHLAAGRYEPARQRFEEALERARQGADFMNEARILANLGATARRDGDLMEARRRFEQARRAAEALGWHEGVSNADARLQELSGSS